MILVPLNLLGRQEHIISPPLDLNDLRKRHAEGVDREPGSSPRLVLGARADSGTTVASSSRGRRPREKEGNSSAKMASSRGAGDRI